MPMHDLHRAQASRSPAHRPWPRDVVTAAPGAAVDTALGGGRATYSVYGASADARAHGTDGERPSQLAWSSASHVRDGTFPSIGTLHPPAIRLERAIRISMACSRLVRPMCGLGSIMALGDAPSAWCARTGAAREPTMHFCPSKARDCIKSPSVLFMPALSSRGISASPPTARPWRGSRSASAMSTKASSRLMAGATIRARGASCRPHLRRQYRGLWLRLRAGRRSGPARWKRRRARMYLRALMAELERLANHFGDIGAICNDAAFALMHAHCGIFRERVLARCATPVSAIG